MFVSGYTDYETASFGIFPEKHARGDEKGQRHFRAPALKHLFQWNKLEEHSLHKVRRFLKDVKNILEFF
jgi:hypothetical protein